MNYEDDFEKRGFLQRYGFVVGIAAIALICGALVIGNLAKSDHKQVHKMPEVVMIRPLPEPPPPPPPPEPPKEVVEKMIEQEPINPQEDKPDDRPKDSAPAVTTNVTGTGSDAFGLGGPGKGGGGGGDSGGHHSRFGWYAGEVQRTIQEALGRSAVTSRAEFERKVGIWADITGRVTRVRVVGSKDDPAINQAIDDVLTGLLLPEPPPKEMPMPIVLRLVARRPG
jgi:outer membrane biosynthesis protein TonB